MLLYPLKICGITNEADAFSAAQAGASYLGYILNAPTSPRYIRVNTAAAIIKRVRQIYPAVKHVGVFVDASSAVMDQVISQLQLDVVQLHGQESLQDIEQLIAPVIWKTVIVSTPDDLQQLHLFQRSLARSACSAILLDSGQGSGQTIASTLLDQVTDFSTIILAGGITPDNVTELIQRYHPAIIDVNSGVEAVPGKKDIFKIKQLIQRLNRL
ncbi:MAG: phosphoribosylanthranilate isomerase [Candidatus Kerfeldbacteria bacterium]|nr:phosphoribosylanthranilate isomerase [Candidatus Kerfeldbacteria bacterium]